MRGPGLPKPMAQRLDKLRRRKPTFPAIKPSRYCNEVTIEEGRNRVQTAMKKLIPFLLALLASSVIWAAPQARQRPVGQAASQAPETRATIEGTVSRADSGQPLKGARVTLQASNRGQGQAPLIAGLAGPDGRVLASLAAAVATVTTDGNGRFTFTGVNPGQYQISADRDGFIRSQYGQRTPTANGAIVPVSANQHLTIDLKMLQASVVSGRIITAEGEPAAQATVQAYTYQYSNGQRTLAEVKNVQTNDLGEYRLFWLAPGEYFVSVSNSSAEDDSPVGVTDVSQGRAARGAVGALRVLTAITDRGGPLVQALGGSTTPPIFYPGTIDPDGAIPITVPASVEVRGMDFQLRPMRTATVSGRVVAPFPLSQSSNNALRGARGVNGAEAAPLVRVANAPVQLSLNRVGNSRTGLAGLLNLRLGSTPVNADGSFEIKGVAPGEYNLAATARDANGQQYTSRTRISVGTSDVANLTASVRPGVELRGKIILDGTPPQQFSMSNLRVSIIADGLGFDRSCGLCRWNWRTRRRYSCLSSCGPKRNGGGCGGWLLYLARCRSDGIPRSSHGTSTGRLYPGGKNRYGGRTEHALCRRQPGIAVAASTRFLAGSGRGNYLGRTRSARVRCAGGARSGRGPPRSQRRLFRGDDRWDRTICL